MVDQQNQAPVSMSPDVEKGLKEALGSSGALGDSTASMFGPIKSLAESTGRIEQIKQKYHNINRIGKNATIHLTYMYVNLIE